MKAFGRTILFLIVLTAPAAQSQSGQIRVFAGVDTSRPVYEGDQFIYQIVIDGSDVPGEVDVGPLKAYDPQPLPGERRQTIVNDRVSVTCVMKYALTARQAGRLQLPAVEVSVKGQVYTTQPLAVQVVKAGETEKFDIEVELGASRCYMGQAVPVTVRWFIWASDYRNVGDFNFDVPFFSSGLFTVEDTADGADAQKTHMFNGEPVTLYQRQTKHDGVDSVEVFFSKVLIPRKAGRIQLEPATVAVNLAVGYSRRRSNSPLDDFFGSSSIFGRSLEYQRFAARSKPITLDVLGVPAEGKPSDFSGLVGRYTISAAAAPTAVNVGDPITLTIRIGGSRYLKPVQQPDLARLPGFGDNFKMPDERDEGKVEGGVKVFRQMLRATHDKVTEIPAIPLSYFDAEKGEYARIQSKAIPLEVAPTRVVTEADLQGPGAMVVRRSVEAAQMGLSAHFEGVEALKDQSFSPLAALIAPGYALLWCGPLVMLVVSGIVKAARRDTPEKIAAARRRMALRNGVRAARRAGRRSGSECRQALGAAMKQYAADKFNRSAKSLTAQDCYELIVEATSNSGAAADYRELIERCESSTYSGAEIHEAVDAKKAVELMRTIDRGVR